jgi:SnoaL-like protein
MIQSPALPSDSNKETLMSKHVAISPNEAADRLAIRELVEAYAHCADRRDAKGQMSLFTPEAHFVVYMNAQLTRRGVD